MSTIWYNYKLEIYNVNKKFSTFVNSTEDYSTIQFAIKNIRKQLSYYKTEGLIECIDLYNFIKENEGEYIDDTLIGYANVYKTNFDYKYRYTLRSCIRSNDE